MFSSKDYSYPTMQKSKKFIHLIHRNSNIQGMLNKIKVYNYVTLIVYLSSWPKKTTIPIMKLLYIQCFCLINDIKKRPPSVLCINFQVHVKYVITKKHIQNFMTYLNIQ